MKIRYKIILSLFFFLILLSLIIYFLSFTNKSVVTYNVIDSIEGYGYTLDDRDSEYFVSEFNILKDMLSESEVDYEEYSSQLSKLFIIDFYSLYNKVNKYDVGSTEYIIDDFASNFSLKASETIYKYIGIIDDLPEVVDVNIVSNDTVTFDYNDETYDAYEVYLEWEYKKDYGYDKKGYITLILEDNKIYVVELVGDKGDEDS